MRITRKGQVTIPQDIRERFGFLPLTQVEFVTEGDRVYLKRVEGGLDRGELIVRHLAGRATIKMSYRRDHGADAGARCLTERCLTG